MIFDGFKEYRDTYISLLEDDNFSFVLYSTLGLSAACRYIQYKCYSNYPTTYSAAGTLKCAADAATCYLLSDKILMATATNPVENRLYTYNVIFEGLKELWNNVPTSQEKFKTFFSTENASNFIYNVFHTSNSNNPKVFNRFVGETLSSILSSFAVTNGIYTLGYAAYTPISFTSQAIASALTATTRITLATVGTAYSCTKATAGGVKKGLFYLRDSFGARPVEVVQQEDHPVPGGPSPASC